MTLKQILYFPLMAAGIDLRKVMRSFCGLFRYIDHCRRFCKMRGRDKICCSFCAPCTTDWYESSGNVQSPYFLQDLYVARKIYEANPCRHVDVGSRIDGFVAHVASFRCIEEIDIRPNPAKIPHVIFRQADFMKELPKELIGCCDSASCLHALEHFGLGRYCDMLNPDGYLVGLENLWRLLKPGGKLYLSVPIGPTRVEFNSQRVFSVAYAVRILSDRFAIKEFSYIDDACVLHDNVDLTPGDIENSFGCSCGCGIFILVKR